MRKALVILTVLAALAIPAAASASLHATDPTGDSNGAPDLTTVDVSNDSSGTITFNIGFVSHTLASDEDFFLAVNTDANTATGDSSGVDAYWDLGANGWGFAKWNGTGFAFTTQHGPMNVTLTSTNFTVTVNKADFGNTSKFTFFVLSDKGPGDSTDVQDSAPDGTGVYTYSLASVAGIQLHLQPGTNVRAGGTFSVTGATVKLSDGSTAPADSVSCKAKLGSMSLTANGPCSFKVPKSAKGKAIVVKVTVSYQGQTFTATVVVHVRKK